MFGRVVGREGRRKRKKKPPRKRAMAFDFRHSWLEKNLVPNQLD